MLVSAERNELQVRERGNVTQAKQRGLRGVQKHDTTQAAAPRRSLLILHAGQLGEPA